MSDAATDLPRTDAPVLLYDGVCGFCNSSVQFILKHDKAGRFRFAALQSEYAQEMLRRFGMRTDDFDTVVLVEDGRPYTRSTAALKVARGLGGAWKALYALVVVPRFVRDFAYNQFAKHRYRVFGKLDACMLPPPEARSRFLG